MNENKIEDKIICGIEEIIDDILENDKYSKIKKEIIPENNNFANKLMTESGYTYKGACTMSLSVILRLYLNINY